MPSASIVIVRHASFRRLSDRGKLSILAASLLIPIELTVWFSAQLYRIRIENDGTPLLQIELADKAILRARQIRTIDAGELVKTIEGWALVPRAEIKRITEIERK